MTCCQLVLGNTVSCCLGQLKHHYLTTFPIVSKYSYIFTANTHPDKKVKEKGLLRLLIFLANYKVDAANDQDKLISLFMSSKFILSVSQMTYLHSGF